jgi:hypothetical protein
MDFKLKVTFSNFHTYSYLTLDLSDPGRVAVILLSEGRRLLGSHLQHSAFNFLLFSLVSQQAHTVFISLIGWNF